MYIIQKSYETFSTGEAFLTVETYLTGEAMRAAAVAEMILIYKEISRLRTVLERSIKAQIKAFEVNLYISNKGVCILDVELSSVVLWKKMQIYQSKQNVFEESYLDSDMS